MIQATEIASVMSCSPGMWFVVDLSPQTGYAIDHKTEI